MVSTCALHDDLCFTIQRFDVFSKFFQIIFGMSHIKATFPIAVTDKRLRVDYSCDSPHRGVYYKAWNCREWQKGQKGNGCRCRLISEESLIAEIVKALGWETMDEGRFSREVSRVLVGDDDVQVE